MFLSKKEIKQLSSKIIEIFKIEEPFKKKDKIERKENIIYKDNQPVFFEQNNLIIPHLKLLLKNNFLKKVTIDMPAVPFMIKGADLMRPGIVEIEEGIEKDQIVSIIDEKNKTPIALGITLYTSEEIKSMDKGKVIKNIHYVGDEIWKS